MYGEDETRESSMEKTLIPDDVNMTRSHLPAPAVQPDSVVVTIGSPEAKLVDPNDHLAQPKPSGARCRLCDSTEDPDLLIKPCRCDGSQKYVHRDCLDQLRSFNENNQAFMNCRDCEYRYWIDVRESYKPDKTCCGQPQRVWHFRGLVARDTAAIFILLQGVITLFAFAVERADSCASSQGCGTECGDVEPYGYVCGKGVNGTIYGGALLNEFGILKMNAHYKTTYYFLGMLFFLATIGVVACLHSCCWFCDNGNSNNKSVNGYTQSCVDQYTCYYCWYDCPCCWSHHNSLGCCCYSNNYSHRRYQPVGTHVYIGGGQSQNCNCCDGCNCGRSSVGSCNNCNCGGGNGDGAGVLVVVAIVLFVILVVAGFIYGLILLTLIMTKIVQKHYAVAQRRQLTRAYIVRDLDGVFLPSVGEERMVQGHMIALPSAPPINEIELRAFGLL